MRTRKASQLALSLDTPPPIAKSIRGKNTNSTDITRNTTRRSKRLLDVNPQQSLVVPEAIDVVAGAGLQKIFEDDCAVETDQPQLDEVEMDQPQLDDKVDDNFYPTAAVARGIVGNNNNNDDDDDDDDNEEEYFSLDDDNYAADDRKLPAKRKDDVDDGEERKRDDDDDDDRKRDDDDDDDERKHDDDEDNDDDERTRNDDHDDDDDDDDERKRDDNHDDDDEDYAEMSEVDVSDDDDGYIVTKKVAGCKRNSGGPSVPKKGSVPEDVYQAAIKA
jgi:hypothetical protein